MIKRKIDILLLITTLVLVSAVLCTAFIHRYSDNQGHVMLKGMDPRVTAAVNSEALSQTSVTEAKQIMAETAQPTSAPATQPIRTMGLGEDLKQHFDLGAACGLGSGIQLAQVSVQQIKETSSLPFETEYEYSDQLAAGTQEIIQYGMDGMMEILYRDVYHDGQLYEREQIGHTITQLPQTQIIRIGTYTEPAPQAVLAAAAAPEAAPAPTETEVPVESPAEEIVTEVPAATEAPVVTEAPVEATAPPVQEEPELPDNGPLEVPTDPPAPAASSVGFMTPGTRGSTQANYNIVASLLNLNGASNYLNFSDNGNGTITVDGVTLPVSGQYTWKTTCYDGYECAKIENFARGQCSPTATGLYPARGIVAAALNGLPFGTVVFIEDYGLAVVADRHGMGPGMLDMAYNPQEISQGVYLPTANRRVYIISIP